MMPDQGVVRVLHLVHGLRANQGGMQTYLSSLATSLADSRISLELAAVDNCGGETAPIPVVHQGKSGASGIANARRLARWLPGTLRSADVVEIHGCLYWHFPIAAAMCRQAGKPYIVRPHGTLIPWSRAQARSKQALFLNTAGRFFLQSAAAVATTTEWDADLIRGRLPRANIVVAPPGIPVPDHPISDAARGAQQLRIIMICLMSPVKGIPLLVEAAAQLVRQGYDLSIDLVGSGTPAYEAALRDKVLAHGLENRVNSLGYLQGRAKAAALCRANIFVLPAYRENFSFATAEAMAAGLPVVVTSQVGLHQTVLRYRCGSVVPAGDAAALAGALAENTDPNLRIQRGRRAFECATAEFSLKAMGATLQALYARVAGSASP